MNFPRYDCFLVSRSPFTTEVYGSSCLLAIIGNDNSKKTDVHNNYHLRAVGLRQLDLQKECSGFKPSGPNRSHGYLLCWPSAVEEVTVYH